MTPRVPPPPLLRSHNHTAKSVYIAIAFGVSGVLVALLLLAVVLAPTPDSTAPIDNSNGIRTAAQAPTPTENPPNPGTTPGWPSAEETPAPPPATQPEKDETDRNQQPPSKVAPTKPRTENVPDPFADIKARNFLLRLPKNNQSDLLGRSTKPHLIAWIYTKHVDSCRLRIATRVSSPNSVFELRPHEAPPGGRRFWTLQHVKATGQGGTSRDEPTTVGTFQLASEKVEEISPRAGELGLFFNWDTKASPKLVPLVNQLQLAIEVRGASVVCKFTPKLVLPSVAIFFGAKKELGVDLSDHRNLLSAYAPETQFISLTPRNFPANAELVIHSRQKDVEPFRIPLDKADRHLRDISVEDLDLGNDTPFSIVVPSRLPDKPPLVAVRIRFHSPQRARHAVLSVRWECLILNNTNKGTRVGFEKGFTLADAERSALKLRTTKNNLKRTESALQQKIRSVLAMNVQLNRQMHLTANSKILFRLKNDYRANVNELQETQRELELNRVKQITLKAHEHLPAQVKSVMEAMHDKASLGWALNALRDGKRTQLIGSE